AARSGCSLERVLATAAARLSAGGCGRGRPRQGVCAGAEGGASALAAGCRLAALQRRPRALARALVLRPDASEHRRPLRGTLLVGFLRLPLLGAGDRLAAVPYAAGGLRQGCLRDCGHRRGLGARDRAGAGADAALLGLL